MTASAREEKDWRPFRSAAAEGGPLAARLERRRSPAKWPAAIPVIRRSTSTMAAWISGYGERGWGKEKSCLFAVTRCQLAVLGRGKVRLGGGGGRGSAGVYVDRSGRSDVWVPQEDPFLMS
ncbi:hypothetical protein HPP92_010705 [Vanilla planifolia]|uniref:Uncharacterized protein n=1 Tax=Vanilla planifolia TaxID=51239 RepID=A0A835V4B7_VANPL|nr:hypothetical protein HPP92_010705 [Vanilla planifolia]